jgi:hypothetical protein
MRLLLAIFFPPGYFFVAGKPIAGVFHLIWWCLSIPMIFVGIGFFMYFIQLVFALYDYRQYAMVQQATLMAEKMAERITISDRTQ